jgi:hypothetical protein
MAQPTPEEVATVTRQYDPLYSQIETRTSPQQPLLLAHYTSIETAERILKNDELWLSNPLYMNDLEEMRVGIAVGNELFPRYAQARHRSRGPPSSGCSIASEKQIMPTAFTPRRFHFGPKHNDPAP